MEKYDPPVMEIICFENEDIIITSDPTQTACEGVYNY